jgi:hypothetical protein
VHKETHQAILRAFATTGRPPHRSDLDRVVAGSSSDTDDVLTALHELDAIRLAPDGQIAVAYPFSVVSTRHRVRIGEGVEVYAMCAIDALGVAAMLEQDTHIHSIDPTTGQPIVVTTTGGVTRWAPSTAVVFLGATAGGGPSADRCCDYLNFFTDPATANAWTRAHSHVRGQVLTPADAEALGIRLFRSLLATR